MDVGGEGRRGERSVWSVCAQRALFDVGVRRDGEDGGGEGRKKRFLRKTSDILRSLCGDVAGGRRSGGSISKI